LVRSCSSRAMARLISPMLHRRVSPEERIPSMARESRPWKMSAGKYRHLAPQRLQSAMIHESGNQASPKGHAVSFRALAASVALRPS
jgi:hypothetical protein